MKAKSTFRILLMAVLAITTTFAIAQSGANGAQKVFNSLMSFNTDITLPTNLGKVRQIDGDIYMVGSFTSAKPTPPYGQTISYNGVIKFPNGDLRNPQTVGNGIPMPTGHGVYDLVKTPDGTLWSAAEGYGNSKLYRFDGTDWVALPVYADTMIKFLEVVDDTTLLLIGPCDVINGITVNKIATYNTVTGAITPVHNSTSGGTGLFQYARPFDVSRTDNLIYIAGRAGLQLYNTTTRTLTEENAGFAFNFQFFGHGDTMYAQGVTNAGTTLARKIGNGTWETIVSQAEDKFMLFTLDKGKILLLGDYNNLTDKNGTIHNCNSMMWDETTESLQPSLVKNLTGLLQCARINGTDDFLGWGVDCALYTTKALTTNIMDPISETLKLYPNPATNYFIVEGAKEGTDITVTDITGKIMLTIKTTEAKTFIDTQNFGSGIYFVNRHKLLVAK